MLDLSFLIYGVFNDVFVSAFLLQLAYHQFIRSGHVLFSTCMLQSAAVSCLVVLLVFQVFVINVISFHARKQLQL